MGASLRGRSACGSQAMGIRQSQSFPSPIPDHSESSDRLWAISEDDSLIYIVLVACPNILLSRRSLRRGHRRYVQSRELRLLCPRTEPLWPASSSRPDDFRSSCRPRKDLTQPAWHSLLLPAPMLTQPFSQHCTSRARRPESAPPRPPGPCPSL